MADELPAAPGSRIYVTKDVTNVSKQVITADVAKLSGKARIDAIEKEREEPSSPNAKRTPATAAPCRPTTAAWSST
jgi:hypothetical protein